MQPLTEKREEARDFASALRSRLSEQELLRGLEHAAQAAQIEVLSQTLTHAAATPQQLGRQEVSLQLRGTYAGIKLFLREALSRWPGCTLSSLRLRRETATTTPVAGTPASLPLEAQVHLVVWTAPLPNLSARQP